MDSGTASSSLALENASSRSPEIEACPCSPRAAFLLSFTTCCDIVTTRVSWGSAGEWPGSRFTRCVTASKLPEDLQKCVVQFLCDARAFIQALLELDAELFRKRRTRKRDGNIGVAAHRDTFSGRCGHSCP
jgi:hypothetical protein